MGTSELFSSNRSAAPSSNIYQAEEIGSRSFCRGSARTQPCKSTCLSLTLSHTHTHTHTHAHTHTQSRSFQCELWALGSATSGVDSEYTSRFGKSFNPDWKNKKTGAKTGNTRTRVHSHLNRHTHTHTHTFLCCHGHFFLHLPPSLSDTRGGCGECGHRSGSTPSRSSKSPPKLPQ